MVGSYGTASVCPDSSDYLEGLEAFAEKRLTRCRGADVACGPPGAERLTLRRQLPDQV